MTAPAPDNAPKSTPRSDNVEQCPRCRQLAWEAEKIYGRAARYVCDGCIDCPNCEAIISVKRGAAKGEAELLEGEPEESIAQAVRDVTDEDRRRGKHGGGGGSSGRRKPKPRARMEVRWEQEPPMFANGRGGGDMKSEQTLEVALRRDLRLTNDTKERLSTWAYRESRIRNRKIHMADGIRRAIKAELHTLEVVEHFGVVDDRVSLQIYFYPQELAVIDTAADALLVVATENRATARGEVVEACLLAWLPGAEGKPLEVQIDE